MEARMMMRLPFVVIGVFLVSAAMDTPAAGQEWALFGAPANDAYAATNGLSLVSAEYAPETQVPVQQGSVALYDGSCVGGCDTCCDCGWYVGAGGYVLTPRWTSNPALAASSGTTGIAVTDHVDFQYGLSFAPVVWIG